MHDMLTQREALSRGLIPTRQRIWEIDDEKFPDRTPAEWLAIIKAARDGRGIRIERRGVELAVQTHNMVLYQGMETLARLLHGAQSAPPAWCTGRWYKQAVGSGGAAPTTTDEKLGVELFRKGFTEFLRDVRVLTTSTLFTGAEYTNARTTVASGGTTTAANLTSATGFRTGDLVRVGLSTGYEYRIITLSGVAVTFDTALSSAPPNGTTIDQMTDEAAVFGDEGANYTTGTATFTQSSAVVTGSGTAWLSKVAAGDYIRLTSAPGNFYEILSVDGDTQITLTSNFLETTAAGAAYTIKGTAFNRVNALHYLKTTRGFVFENQWTMGG